MGLREWWDRINGGKNEPDETGTSEASEERYDEYHSQKADTAAEQRDPGVIGMGQGDDRGGV
jgi:hypothetical protein